MRKKMGVAALVAALLLFTLALAESAGKPGIIGSDAQAVMRELEAYGISIPTPEQKAGLTEWESSDVTINGAECSYTITANAAGEIINARFIMEGKKNDLLTVAASLNYEAADSSKAVKFVKNNLGKNKSTIIGDAEFILEAGDGLLITAGGMSKYKIYELTIRQNDALTSGEGVIATVTKGVNIRAEDNSDSARVGHAEAGEELMVTKPYYNPTWHQINYNGQIAYVSAKYCKLNIE